MGRKNKVFEPKGQKETMDLLKELFGPFPRRISR